MTLNQYIKGTKKYEKLSQRLHEAFMSNQQDLVVYLKGQMNALNAKLNKFEVKNG